MDSLSVSVTSDSTADDIATTIAEYVEQGSKPFNYHPTEEGEMLKHRQKRMQKQKLKRMQKLKRNKMQQMNWNVK